MICVYYVWGGGGGRVAKTHQDIRRVTHTGGVYEGGLTSLTPERQVWKLLQLLYAVPVYLCIPSALTSSLFVRTNKMEAFAMLFV